MKSLFIHKKGACLDILQYKYGYSLFIKQKQKNPSESDTPKWDKQDL
jgi:hypothetical protein